MRNLLGNATNDHEFIWFEFETEKNQKFTFSMSIQKSNWMYRQKKNPNL